MHITKLFTFFIFTSIFYFQNIKAQSELVYKGSDGVFKLSPAGASYFAKLSLACTNQKTPHMLDRYEVKDKDPEHYWASFYGCYDWHSAVHNHWALLKLLINFPGIPEATDIYNRLNSSFSENSIAREVLFFEKNEDGWYEFPYGQAWLLKIADELYHWKDPQAKVWLNRLNPLIQHMETQHLAYWSHTDSIAWSGSHDSPALGMSFAFDYALSTQQTELQSAIRKAALGRYLNTTSLFIENEPDTLRYDFMSAGFLVADLMRKVLSETDFYNWLKKCEPHLFNASEVAHRLPIKYRNKHKGMEAHYDGYYLNRIWCMNGILKTLSPEHLNSKSRKEWAIAMNAMWDYAQKSIGKGNYDIDHWLSSFSVFALSGYESNLTVKPR